MIRAESEGMMARRLLRDHARTFSPTLRLLPKRLRDPLELAYLLARASDTIADSGSMPTTRRAALIKELEGVLATGNFAQWLPEFSLGDFSTKEGELLFATPALLARLARHSDRAEIVTLLSNILKGQLFDLRRFPSERPLSPPELECYCADVAGSVGVTWTHLIAIHAPHLLKLPAEELIPKALSYGKGLQLLNILRDRSADLALGRIYVEEKNALEMIALTRTWLSEGESYLQYLRPGRLLYAASLPLVLAWRTLGKIQAGTGVSPVKIRRSEIRMALLRNLTSLWLPRCRNRDS
jgi:farnesyl-diphosphate farnesyltransferase